MPINFTDFSRAPLVDNGLGDLIGKAIQGFQAQRLPGMMNRQQQQEELRNKLLGMRNQYYPQIQEQKLRQGDLAEQTARFNLEHLPEEFARKQKESELRQSLLSLKNQFLPETHRANIDLLNARADKARRLEASTGKNSQIYNDLAKIYGEGSPEFTKAYQQIRSIPGATTPSSEEVSLADLPKNEQLDQTKRMRNDLRAAHDVKKAVGTLREMRKITEQYPNLSDTLSAVFIDPKKEASITSRIGKTFLDKNERAAVEKYIKLSNDLILQGGQGLGPKNFTDAKAKILEMAKPYAGATQQANLFVIDNMIRNLEPWEAYAQDLKRGLKERKSIEFDLGKYETPEEDEWEVVG